MIMQSWSANSLVLVFDGVDEAFQADSEEKPAVLEEEKTTAEATSTSNGASTGSLAVAKLRQLARATRGANAPWVDSVSLKVAVPELIAEDPGLTLIAAQVACRPRVFRVPPSGVKGTLSGDLANDSGGDDR